MLIDDVTICIIHYGVVVIVVVIVVVLIGPGVMFRHIDWIGCDVLTHRLNRVSHFDIYIGSGVTFQYDNSVGMSSMREPRVIIMFMSTYHRY